MILKVILILIQLSIMTIYGYLVWKSRKYKNDKWSRLMVMSLLSLSAVLSLIPDPIKTSDIVLTIVLAIGLLLYALDVIRLR